MKLYKISFIFDDGTFYDMGKVETNDPKRVLFDKVCEFLVTHPNFNDSQNTKNIWDGIKQYSHTGRERYYYEANDNVLLITEVLPYTMADWERDGTLWYKIGQIYDDEVIEELKSCVPPHYLSSDAFQPGEPAATDPETRTPFYRTFKKIKAGWQYVGLHP